MTDLNRALFDDYSSITYSNINTLWGHATIEALRVLGVTRFVISPGSRNTPLTFACSRLQGIEVEVAVDERSAAFFALGWSKSSGRQPVALICTSGSALAHYLPALVEARYGHIPLLIISADRPDELQNCHAGQTISQERIYGEYAESFLQAPLPEINAWDSFSEELISIGEKLKLPSSFASHINQPFRDPLTPGVEDGSRQILEPFGKSVQQTKTLADNSAITRIESETTRIDPLPPKSLFIIGPLNIDTQEEEYLSAFIEKIQKDTGASVLCDGLSSFRFRDLVPISHYDIFLRNESVAASLRPDALYLIGDMPTSKVLRKTIERWDSKNTTIALDSDPEAGCLR